MSERFDVVGIGNALVDILARVNDDFLAENRVEKGVMTLIDTARAAELYARMGPATAISGGSGANTIAGLAMLGSRAAYVGKVRDDQLGAIFAHDLRAQGAVFETPMASGDHDCETGRCMVLVSPDGERSMSTYLGVSEYLSPSDIDEEMMGRADWLYLEGYRFDGPDSHEAFARAIAACKRGGGRASVTLSDPFCVDRHRDAFRRLIHDDLDLVFANEHEVRSLYETDSLEAALAAVGADVRLAAVTVGPGAFTGLRIGLAAARGLALAAGLPCFGATTTETVAHAKTLTEHPVILLDHADNVGSGGTEDVMTVIAEVMRQELDGVAVAAVWDPEAARLMGEAGLGAEVTLPLGGRTDMPSIGLKGQPLIVTGRVARLSEGRFKVEGPMYTGVTVNMGPTALLDTGRMQIVVVSRHHEPWDLGVFTSLGIDPAIQKYLLLKSRIHYRAGFGALARHTLHCDGEGVTTSDNSRLVFRNVRRPIFPLDAI